MTISKAINEAMKEFNRTTGKEKKAEIRNICLQEGTGHGNEWTEIVIKIEYAIEGDYKESDEHPFYAVVKDYKELNKYLDIRGRKRIETKKLKLDF